MNGWIKVDRSVLDWEWYTDLNTFKLWMHINLTCNIVPQKRMLGYTLNPGQVITTLPRLAAESGLTLQEVRTALKHLESSGDITQKVTNKFRLITLEKWAFSQGCENATNSQLTDQQQPTNRPTTGVKKEDKNKELNNILSMRDAIKKPKRQNRFINYPQSYTDAEIAEIEMLERQMRIDG